jgi:hypothetical protein
MHEKRLAQFIPREGDLFIVSIETLCPKITGVTGSAELRIDNRDRGVAKLRIDRAHHGGLQPARHCDVVGINPPAVFRQLALEIEDIAGPGRGGQDAPKLACVVKASLSFLFNRMTEFSPVTITLFTSTVLIADSPN